MLRILRGVNCLFRKINLFFISQSRFEKWFELEYFLKKNNLKFNFNLLDFDNEITFNTKFISSNNLKFIKKNISYVDVDRIADNISCLDCIYIFKKDFDNPYNKVVLSWIISPYIKIKLIDKKKHKKIRKITIFKKDFLSWLQSSKMDFIKCISLFISNYSYLKNNKINFINSIDSINHFKNKNIIRIGDGELSILNGENTPFQKFSDDLKIHLEKSINYFKKKERISLNEKMFSNYNFLGDRSWYQMSNCMYFNEYNKIYSANSFSLSPYEIYNKNSILGLSYALNDCEKKIQISNNKLYRNDKNSKILNYYNDFWKNFFNDILKNKVICLISNINNKFFLNLDLFDDKSNKTFIEVKGVNSFESISETRKILNTYFKRYNKSQIVFLIAAGPMGKILCEEIDKKLYRFIDIGNFINYYSYYNNIININDISNIHKSKFLKYKRK